jgi:hypothetical protein
MRLAPFALLLAAAPALAAEGPELEKTSILFAAQNHNELVTDGKHDDLTYSWTPRIQLKVYGPVAAGSQYVVEVGQPGGKPWVELKLDTPEVAAGVSAKLESGAVPVDKGIAATGEVPFVIRLRNELTKKDEVVFKGKANVKKFHVNGAAPKYKNTFYYYVDEDWRLPVGELWWNTKEDPEAPALMAAVWVRGPLSHKDVGYLSYEGKQYCSTAGTGQGDLHDMSSVVTSFGGDKQEWTQAVMWFNCTRMFNKHGSDGVTLDGNFHIADKHPGKYELKMMREGKVARTTEFTIGDDGNIVDNGLTAKNSLGGHKFVFPFKVVGNADGKIDAGAWKGGIYGNPIAGFQP